MCETAQIAQARMSFIRQSIFNYFCFTALKCVLLLRQLLWLLQLHSALQDLPGLMSAGGMLLQRWQRPSSLEIWAAPTLITHREVIM